MNRFFQSAQMVLCSLVVFFPFTVHLWASEGDSKPWGQGEVFAARPAMRQVTLTGYTRARHTMDIVSEEEGPCFKVAADVGNTIGEDGVFCVLDTTFVDIAIDKNRIDQKRVENRIAYEIKEVRRFEELVGRDSAAQSTLDAHQNRLDQSRFELEALKNEGENLRERQVRHTSKVPPWWTITERAVEPGQWISAGGHLGKAGDFRKLLVPFSLSPDEYSVLKRLKGTTRLHFPDEG